MYAAVPAHDNSALVEEHAYLVKRIAYHLIARLPASVQVDDLIQAGIIGLLEAARYYDPSQGASFKTYAGIRIRGAMLDEIRRSDWTPRSVHRKAREVAEAIRAVENREGRDASDQEIAAELGVGLDEYFRTVAEAATARVLSLDELTADEGGEDRQSGLGDPAAGPYRQLVDQAARQALTEVIGNLPEREQQVLSLYYEHELNLREIGEVLSVTESRVCQIHGRALARIRARMTDWREQVETAQSQ